MTANVKDKPELQYIYMKNKQPSRNNLRTLKWQGAHGLGSPLTINTSGGVPNSECSTTSVLASAAIAEEASVLAVSHVAVPVAHSCADRTTSNTLHHPWSIRNILCRLSGESNLKMYSFHISQLNNTK